MNEQEIIEGNVLIARFEGRKWLNKYTIDFYGGDTGNQIPEMKYHKSWDWLMKVVEKISIDYDFTIRWFNRDCTSTIYNTSIEGSEISDYGNYKPAIKNVWLCVVKFIKWYNLQNP